MTSRVLRTYSELKEGILRNTTVPVQSTFYDCAKDH